MANLRWMRAQLGNQILNLLNETFELEGPLPAGLGGRRQALGWSWITVWNFLEASTRICPPHTHTPTLPVPAHCVYMCSIPIGVDIVNNAPCSSFILRILFLTVEACCDECRPPACKPVLIGWTAFLSFFIWHQFYWSVPTDHPIEGSRCTEHPRTLCSTQRSIVGMWMCVMDEVCMLPTKSLLTWSLVSSSMFLSWTMTIRTFGFSVIKIFL